MISVTQGANSFQSVLPVGHELSTLSEIQSTLIRVYSMKKQKDK